MKRTIYTMKIYQYENENQQKAHEKILLKSGYKLMKVENVVGKNPKNEECILLIGFYDNKKVGKWSN